MAAVNCLKILAGAHIFSTRQNSTRVCPVVFRCSVGLIVVLYMACEKAQVHFGFVGSPAVARDSSSSDQVKKNKYVPSPSFEFLPREQLSFQKFHPVRIAKD